ncbi:MAG: universal stress protein [Verrucomicrobiales bacterium]|nr:universal stress protein [Verrucomicrobiales bacterium]MCP5526564.1 universal stress protein [Verrucomicrobiales bacterium]
MNNEQTQGATGGSQPQSAASALNLRRILVPLDFSERAGKALHYARALASGFSATLVLVHVVEPLVYPSDLGYAPVVTDDLANDLQKEAQTRLDAAVGEMTAAGLSTTGVLRSGRPYLEIAAAAEQERADLIVLTTHGYTGLKHVLLGSTAERVVRHAPCPVLVVRDPAASAGTTPLVAG